MPGGGCNRPGPGPRDRRTVDTSKIAHTGKRITPAEHLRAAQLAKAQRDAERKAHLAKARAWAEERRKHMIPPHHPAYEYVTTRLANDRDNKYPIDEPWCFQKRLTMHLTRWYELTQTPTNNVVYYIKVGKYVKIGTSRNLDQRIKHYPPDAELLATEPGGRKIETMRHQQFAKYLSARHEWFEPGPKLMRHIEGLQRHAVTQMRAALDKTEAG
jgi:hypothetical protein